MAAEVIYVDGTVFSLTNLSGAYTDIDDDADNSASDTDFVSAISNAPSTLRASFGTPSGNPTTGTGVQNFKVRLRLTQNAPQDITWELRETGGGSALQSGTVSVTSTSFATYTISWDAANLADADGSEVEIYLSGGSSLGPPANRWTFEISACEWNVDYSAATQVALTGSAATASAGSLGNEASLVLTGEAASAAAGSLSPSVSIALTGEAATASAGTLTPSTETIVEVALTGSEVSSAAGDFGLSSAVVLSGEHPQTIAGSVSVDINLLASGEAATASAGTLTPSTETEVEVALTGSAVQSFAGLLACESAIAISGAAVSALPWILSAVGGSALDPLWTWDVPAEGRTVTAYEGSRAIAIHKEGRTVTVQ